MSDRRRRSALLLICLAAGLIPLAPAIASDSSRLPGQLIATRVWLYECADPCFPAGWLDVRAAGPSWRFASLRTPRSSVPVLPHISPDGRWLLFGDAEGRLMVQRMRTPRGPVSGLPIVIPGVDAAAQTNWSPDSAQVVIAGSINDERGLWIVDRDGSNARRIVDDTAVRVEDSSDHHAVPVWSARGEIAFVGWPRKYERPYDDPSWWAIYVVRTDGSNLRAVTRPVRNPVRGRTYEVYDSAPSWSPDGRRLVYAHDIDVEGIGDLRTLVVATRSERRLRQAGGAPVWSPDARYVAAITPFPREDPKPSVTVVPSRGGEPRRIRIAYSGGYLVDLAWRGT